MKSILFTFLLLASTALRAQDTLYKTDGSTHIVKVMEIHDQQVKYKPVNQLNGPVFVIDKSSIQKIVYSTGLVETFSKQSIPAMVPAYKTDPRNIDFGRHFIYINSLDLLFHSLTLGYEHTFPSGKISIKCPVSLGFITLGLKNQNWSYQYYNIDNNYYSRNKHFSTGLEVYLYPFGQGMRKFYFGPAVEYGEYFFFQYLGQSQYEKSKATYYAGLLQSGFLLQPTRQVNLSFNLALGYAVSTYTTPLNYPFPYSTSSGSPAIRAGFNLGYKF